MRISRASQWQAAMQMGAGIQVHSSFVWMQTVMVTEGLLIGKQVVIAEGGHTKPTNVDNCSPFPPPKSHTGLTRLKG